MLVRRNVSSCDCAEAGCECTGLPLASALCQPIRTGISIVEDQLKLRVGISSVQYLLARTCNSKQSCMTESHAI